MPTSCLLEPAILRDSFDRFMGDNSIDVLMGTSKYNYHPVQALVLKKMVWHLLYYAYSKHAVTILS